MNREEAWNRIDAIIARHEIGDEYVTITSILDYDALRMARKALEQDKWIPVSERYPEEEGEEYLVCYDDGTIRIRNLFFTVVDNDPYFEYGQGIVAWMPLPEPYVPDINVGDKAESEG